MRPETGCHKRAVRLRGNHDLGALIRVLVDVGRLLILAETFPLIRMADNRRIVVYWQPKIRYHPSAEAVLAGSTSALFSRLAGDK